MMKPIKIIKECPNEEKIELIKFLLDHEEVHLSYQDKDEDYGSFSDVEEDYGVIRDILKALLIIESIKL